MLISLFYPSKLFDILELCIEDDKDEDDEDKDDKDNNCKDEDGEDKLEYLARATFTLGRSSSASRQIHFNEIRL